MTCLKQDRYPRTLPKWQSDAITAQGITVFYPDDVTPSRDAKDAIYTGPGGAAALVVGLI